ncbi:hypothetical protein [Arthrobacter sp. 35/47]|uniref:hypothetical protein n=1 Tax=Arthrobacter sp. 35/47 TaxID=269454 RepID=UPI0004B8E4B5|nr:hypothetical protein [Arthrobacter sp. 35/47]
MLSTASVFALVPPPDEGQLRPGLDPSQVTPGLLGFLMTLFMVIAVILLMRSMAGRVRRVRYRAQAEERQRTHTADASPPTTSPPAALGAAHAPAPAPHTDTGPVS